MTNSIIFAGSTGSYSLSLLAACAKRQLSVYAICSKEKIGLLSDLPIERIYIEDDLSSGENSKNVLSNIFLDNPNIQTLVCCIGGRNIAQLCTHYDELQIKQIFNNNYFAPVQLLNNFMHFFYKYNKKLRIIVFGSSASIAIYPFNSVYASAKHALKVYCQTLQLEHRDTIELIFICPSVINTEDLKQKIAKQSKLTDEKIEDIWARVCEITISKDTVTSIVLEYLMKPEIFPSFTLRSIEKS